MKKIFLICFFLSGYHLHSQLMSDTSAFTYHWDFGESKSVQITSNRANISNCPEEYSLYKQRLAFIFNEVVNGKKDSLFSFYTHARLRGLFEEIGKYDFVLVKRIGPSTYDMQYAMDKDVRFGFSGITVWQHLVIDIQKRKFSPGFFTSFIY